MTFDHYNYDKELVDKYYNEKVLDPTRKYFSLQVKEIAIRKIHLKRINKKTSEATIGLNLSSDKYKNKGFGTDAILQIIEYSKKVLKIKHCMPIQQLEKSTVKIFYENLDSIS